MNKAHLLALLAGLGLPACAPTLYLSMKPETGSKVWHDGHERATAAQDSVVVSVGFVRYEPTALIFDVEVRNQSTRPILVAPEQFTYSPVATTLHSYEKHLAHFEGSIKAINPEQKLDGLTAAVAYNVSESQRAMLLAPVDYAQQHRIEYSAAVLQAQTQKKEVEAHLLRKNTLAPGQGIRGYVYFPRTDGADVLRLELPLRANPVVIPYKQLRSPQRVY
ncbi:hypothetical protein GCM10022408_27390 [Hymenobacter fastidiosus]|uniref:DUF4352 domain-containing protein n=1 Tax=Hymenobacter fastidiosus TaxID=486264 RepID=A0ABP7SKQ6_9BACT